MLFYVQMKWNYQGRISQDQLWELEQQEIEFAQTTVDSGAVKGIYKVAGQPRVIVIIDVESADELDRTVMGRLPMREFLEFEAVWALREYASFAEDVRRRFRDV
ncbi:MAG TPA: muconolactone Delta-isomerase family protein [Casimicrobiaceae bacterium]|nr:muconolactone Delta-isomerase family protein [Casimicrobiaceae bacterium]